MNDALLATPGIVAAALALAALVYARKAHHASRATLDEVVIREEARELEGVRSQRPRPCVVVPEPPQRGSDRLTVQLSNVGGAAQDWYALVLAGDGIFTFHLPIGSSSFHRSFVVMRSGVAEQPLPDGKVEVVYSVARDLEGDWWDVLLDTELEEDHLTHLRERAMERGITVHGVGLTGSPVG